jgi:hypothetical protein
MTDSQSLRHCTFRFVVRPKGDSFIHTNVMAPSSNDRKSDTKGLTSVTSETQKQPGNSGLRPPTIEHNWYRYTSTGSSNAAMAHINALIIKQLWEVL